MSTRTPWLELRTLREKDGYTVAGLARAAGISRPYVSQLESGLREPTPKITKLLADTLDVPVSVLRKRAAGDEATAPTP